MADEPEREKTLDELEREAQKLVSKQSVQGLREETPPTNYDAKYVYTRGSGRMWAYLKTINWPEWWDEFNSALIPKGERGAGRRKYKSAWHFVTKKTRVQWQRQVLWKMIGPAPQPKPGEKLSAPYLGDWDKRRANGFYAFDDPAKVVAIERAIEDRQMGLEATRALAPMIARRLAYWYRVQQLLTDVFAGRLLDDEQRPEGTGKNRIDLFLKWQGRVEDILARLEDQWARVHGVNPLDPAQQYLDMAALGGRIGAAAALTGVAATGAIPGRPTLIQDGQELPLPEDTSYDSILMAQMLKGHERTYGLPLPENHQEKSNGKSKGRTQ